MYVVFLVQPFVSCTKNGAKQ